MADKTLPFTDATIDKMQEVMAVHGFVVPVRVISDAFITTWYAHHNQSGTKMDQAAARLAAGGEAACATCQGHGVVGYHTGQTPEQYEEHTADCPDCTPASPAPAPGAPPSVGGGVERAEPVAYARVHDAAHPSYYDVVLPDSQEAEMWAYALLPLYSGADYAALQSRIAELEENQRLQVAAGVEQERELIVAERRAEAAERANARARGLPEKWRGEAATHRKAAGRYQRRGEYTAADVCFEHAQDANAYADELDTALGQEAE